MKLKTENVIEQEASSAAQKIHLPQGLVGFDHLKEMEIVFQPEELPFMHLHATSDSSIEFIVMEPQGLIADYEVEVLDADLEYLNITDAENILILNIVTVDSVSNKATVNLVGPIIVNRKTLKGKQVVIGNYEKYSAHYVLYEGDNIDLN